MVDMLSGAWSLVYELLPQLVDLELKVNVQPPFNVKVTQEQEDFLFMRLCDAAKQGRLSNLKSLSLSGIKLRDLSDLSDVWNLPTLESVRVLYCGKASMTKKFLEMVRHKIKAVYICASTFQDDDWCKVLGSLTNCTRVSIDNDKVIDPLTVDQKNKALDNLRIFIDKMGHLIKIICISGEEIIGAKDILPLLEQGAQKVEQITMDRVSKISPDVFLGLHFPTVQFLAITMTHALAQASGDSILHALSASFPNLEGMAYSCGPPPHPPAAAAQVAHADLPILSIHLCRKLFPNLYGLSTSGFVACGNGFNEWLAEMQIEDQRSRQQIVRSELTFRGLKEIRSIQTRAASIKYVPDDVVIPCHGGNLLQIMMYSQSPKVPFLLSDAQVKQALKSIEKIRVWGIYLFGSDITNPSPSLSMKHLRIFRSFEFPGMHAKRKTTTDS